MADLAIFDTEYLILYQKPNIQPYRIVPGKLVEVSDAFTHSGCKTMTHAKIEGFSAVWKSQEFKKQSDKAKRWLQVNALGIFVYLLAASQAWGGQNHLGLGAGDPFVWMFTAFPILVIFAIIDTVWLILTLRNTLLDHRNWPQIAFWFVGVAVWMAACIFDWLME